MRRKRIAGPERKASILAAARKVFAQYGYEGAKTLQIAKAANVSEALVYRHYPSKQALYRAVLRQIFREQDENRRVLNMPEPSTEALVKLIKAYLYTVVLEPQGVTHEGYMMMLASLSADGTFASLLYRRWQRRVNKDLEKAHETARSAGDIVGRPLDVADTAMFIEHVGTMLNAIHSLDESSRPYAKSGEELALEAVWFCCRGIGLTDAAIQRSIDA